MKRFLLFAAPTLLTGFELRAARRPAVRPAAADVKLTLAIFGASGGTGGEAVFQALGRGESVSCLARDPSKVVAPVGSGGASAGQPLTNDKLTVTQGSVTEKADVNKVFDGKGITGVVVALGGKTSDVGTTMLRDGTANIIEACKANGVKRISVVTSIGAGDSEGQAPFFFKVLMMTVMKKTFEDKNAQEALFLGGPGADLEFTIVRPGGLSNDPPNGIINVISGEAGSIARADVAAFCLDAVLDADFKYLKSAPCISSEKGTSWVKDKGMPVGGNVAK